MSTTLANENINDQVTDAPLGFAENPAAVIEALYQKVYQQQMQGLPICNDDIEVEAVGFHLWQDQWLGIMITPWFTNLLILRQQGQHWPEFKLAKGNEKMLSFPAGEIKFTPRFEPELGSYLCCSLVSPMNECPSHQQAVLDAKNALRQLTQVSIDVKVIENNEDSSAEFSTKQHARRNFLRGKRQSA